VGSTAREIEQHIASERGKLDRDINELQTRVQNATDWRWQVRKRPLAAVGAALVGGFLAAVLAGRGGRPNVYSADVYSRDLARKNKAPRNKRDVMMGLAMGMGMRRLARYLRS
jgi:hypothetical protein